MPILLRRALKEVTYNHWLMFINLILRRAHLNKPILVVTAAALIAVGGFFLMKGMVMAFMSPEDIRD